MKKDGAWNDTSLTYEQMKKFHDEGNYKVVTPRAHHFALLRLGDRYHLARTLLCQPVEPLNPRS